MICSEQFDFEETMTSIELMDPKMDIRFHRNKVNSNQHAMDVVKSDN